MGFRLRFEDKIVGDAIRISSFFNHQETEIEVWFEIPLEHKERITRLADPFLIGLIFPAMETGNDIIIEGKQVSKGLISNLETFQNIWVKWKPQVYQKINILSEEATEQVKPAGNSICAFTGGVDSSFLLQQAKYDGINIKTAVFVHGFHIPVSNDQAANIHYHRMMGMCDDAGVELVKVKSNLRGLGNWNDIHGASVIACLYLFHDGYSSGVIASSHPFRYLRLPWGSNPVSDIALSSSSFQIINFGGEFLRIEKLDRLKNWKSFVDNVMVCSRVFGDNCGKCEKCVRTLLGFRALNQKTLSTFKDSKLTIKKVILIRAYLSWEIKDYSSLLAVGIKNRPKDLIFYFLFLNISLNKLMSMMMQLLGNSMTNRLRQKIFFKKPKEKLYSVLKH